jgi:thioredoxin-like negative regulator of GroEL
MILEFDGKQPLVSLIHDHKHVLIDFWDDWCSPCKNLSKSFPLLVKENPGLTVIKVKASQFPHIVQQYKLTNLPGLFFYRQGLLFAQHTGALTPGQLTSIVRKLLSE